MNALLLITAFLATVTIREIVQAVSEHVKAKDALKALETVKKTQEAKSREAESNHVTELIMQKIELTRQETAQIEKDMEEAKAALADKILSMTPEQLAAYNREMVKYVPEPTWTLYNQQQEILRWRGW